MPNVPYQVGCCSEITGGTGGPTTYRQARSYSDATLEDVYLPTSSIPAGPANFYFYNPQDGICYYIDYSDPTTQSPGNVIPGWQALDGVNMDICTGSSDLVVTGFSTGQSLSGINDTKYVIENGNDSGVFVAMERVTHENDGIWVQPVDLSTYWVSDSEGGAGWYGDRKVRTTVNIAGNGAYLAGYTLSGYYAVDNELISMYVNGVIVPGVGGGDYNVFTPYNIPGSMLVIGDNLIEWRCRDYGGAAAFYNKFNL